MPELTVNHTSERRAASTPASPGALVRAAANVAAIASVLAGKALIRLGVRRPPEGWRRTVGILLRSEATRFALSAFGLRIPAGAPGDSTETSIARALRAFLAQEPDAHFSLEWRAPVTIRRRTTLVDVVVLRFAPGGSLDELVPFLDPRASSTPAPDLQARAHRAIVDAYNRTSDLPELQRPRMLLQQVRRQTSASARSYAERLLAACCLSFEPREAADRRFYPPAFVTRRTLGFGYLSWVARPDEDRGSVDLWASAHHVGLDGVPLQDLLGRLEHAWGIAERVLFPRAGDSRALTEPDACHAPGERAVDQLVTFVDLSPILDLRARLNARLREAVGGPVTFGALFAWLVGQEPEFAGVRIASTVDVAASDGYERDVDVVSLRPADFASGDAAWGGFVAFAREFNRLVAAARTRTSPVRAGMQTSGLLPAWAHATVVRANPAALDDAFGTLCVTIVRDARVFIAPMTDLGLGRGFFAIGSANLPSTDGGRVAAVSMKGEAGTIAGYPAILQRVVDKCALLRDDDLVS